MYQSPQVHGERQPIMLITNNIVVVVPFMEPKVVLFFLKGCGCGELETIGPTKQIWGAFQRIPVCGCLAYVETRYTKLLYVVRGQCVEAAVDCCCTVC